MRTDESETIFEGYHVSRESRDRIKQFVALLLNWQHRINLIGSSTVPSVWTRHIRDSLQLLPLLPEPCREIADLGTGSGMPGLVVCLATGKRTHLYESNTRKCAFLHEAIRTTEANAVVHCLRLEDLTSSSIPDRVDCVLARALAPLPRLLALAEPFLRQGATGLFHKGRDVDLELTEATRYWKFVSRRHPSASDSSGVVLEVKEMCRVR